MVRSVPVPSAFLEALLSKDFIVGSFFSPAVKGMAGGEEPAGFHQGGNAQGGTEKQHERSRSFSKTGQRGLGKKQRQMGNPVLPLKQGRTGFFWLSERNLQILYKKYGEIRAIYFAKTREKLTFFNAGLL